MVTWQVIVLDLSQVCSTLPAAVDIELCPAVNDIIVNMTKISSTGCCKRNRSR